MYRDGGLEKFCAGNRYRISSLCSHRWEILRSLFGPWRMTSRCLDGEMQFTHNWKTLYRCGMFGGKEVGIKDILSWLSCVQRLR